MDIPSSTYRLQFNRDFGFMEALDMVSYLEALGITSIYASPVFKATPESMHGYDITDPNSINPELGTPADLDDLINYSRGKGLGWIQDIVPNHVAYSCRNYFIADIMENGLNSRYFGFPDINWKHPYIKDKVLAPFLGRLFGEALEEGEITINYNSHGFFIKYYEHEFPLKMESYYNVLSFKIKNLGMKIGNQHPDFIKLLGVLHILKNLPSSEQVGERYEQIDIVKTMLWELYSHNRYIKEFVDNNLVEVNGMKGHPESFGFLHNLLSEQNFRLSFWKVASEEINYRRFFNINELMCIRTERPEVFGYTHELVLKMVRDKKFTGLRIDHIDGLYDPLEYLNRLNEKVQNVYTVVEKILENNEQIPGEWPVQGTTGYDFLNRVNGLFCVSENTQKFSKIYSDFIGYKLSYNKLLYEKKKMIIEKHLTGDIDNLAHLLKQVSARDRHGIDITLNGLRRTLVEIASLFPVYRTYVNGSDISAADRKIMEKALRETKRRNPDLMPEIRYLEKFLLFEFFEYVSDEEKEGWVNFVMRFQQLTGPLMAKGFEDTTLYIYNRLISLNEVGGDPESFGVSIEEFHEFNKNRVSMTPHTINATSTHDTKRGEDIRCRINVLTEIPEIWAKKVKSWSRENRSKKTKVNGSLVPDKNDEYFLYQSIIGGLPFKTEHYGEFKTRLKEYIVKAVREAKVHTAWLEPDTEYENAFVDFIDKVLDFSHPDAFTSDILRFQTEVAFFGIINSLSQTLLKITSPGIPDFYQGTELWDLNFVDPDNRRHVDYKERNRLMDEIREGENKSGRKDLVCRLLDDRRDGKVKMYLIYKSLGFRNENIELYRDGDYIPLETRGEHRNEILAFARASGGKWGITLVPRFVSRLTDYDNIPVGNNVWGDTSVIMPGESPDTFYNILTGETVRKDKKKLFAGEILATFPVALLKGEKRE